MANEQRPYSNYSSSRKQDKAMLEIGKLQPQDTDLEEAVLGAYIRKYCLFGINSKRIQSLCWES